MISILYITSEYTDYLQDQILLGLRRRNDINCIDYPRKDVLYSDCELPNSELHGNGFTIWKDLDSSGNIDRRYVFKRLYNGEFDILIFGSIQRQTNIFQDVNFSRIECPVVFLDGEDKRYYPSIRELVPFMSEWYDRRKRGMKGRPQIGKELYAPALDHGLYFKREKSDYISENRDVFPISFSIPSKKILDSKPTKDQKFQTHVQCKIAYDLEPIAKNSTPKPVFDTEAEYYDDLSKSKYGITMKKGGWECMRHYEIAANWAIPCFYKLSKKPSECAPHGLRDMKNCIIFSEAEELSRKGKYVEEHNLYDAMQKQVVQWAKSRTCRKLADYVLEFTGVV